MSVFKFYANVAEVVPIPYADYTDLKICIISFVQDINASSPIQFKSCAHLYCTLRHYVEDKLETPRSFDIEKVVAVPIMETQRHASVLSMRDKSADSTDDSFKFEEEYICKGLPD